MDEVSSYAVGHGMTAVGLSVCLSVCLYQRWPPHAMFFSFHAAFTLRMRQAIVIREYYYVYLYY